VHCTPSRWVKGAFTSLISSHLNSTQFSSTVQFSSLQFSWDETSDVSALLAIHHCAHSSSWLPVTIRKHILRRSENSSAVRNPPSCHHITPAFYKHCTLSVIYQHLKSTHHLHGNLHNTFSHFNRTLICGGRTNRYRIIAHTVLAKDGVWYKPFQSKCYSLLQLTVTAQECTCTK